MAERTGRKAVQKGSALHDKRKTHKSAKTGHLSAGRLAVCNLRQHEIHPNPSLRKTVVGRHEQPAKPDYAVCGLPCVGSRHHTERPLRGTDEPQHHGTGYHRISVGLLRGGGYRVEPVGKGEGMGAAIMPPFFGRLLDGAGCCVGASGRTPRPPTWQPVAPALLACRQCSGRKGMRRSHGPGSSRPGTIRARLGRPGLRPPFRRRSLARARSLPCLVGHGAARRFGARLPPGCLAAPVAAAPRRLGPRPGWLPVWLRPCLARPPRVGAASLGLRPCCPRVASVRVAGPPGRAFPLAPPPGGRAAAGRGMAAPCSAPPPRLAPGAGVVRCGGVACRWCLWYNRTKVR